MYGLRRVSRVFSDRGILILYFTALILLGSLLLSLAHQGGGVLPSFVDALFTAVSAVSVTGLSTVDASEFSLPGQIVVLILIQLGGIGLLLFLSIHLMPQLRKISFRHRQLLTEMFVDTVEYRPRMIVRSVVLFSLGVELAGTLMLIPLFIEAGVERPIFSALFHSISSFCNAGFSTIPGGLAVLGENYLLLGVMALLIVAGGLGFVVLQDLFVSVRGKKRHLALHTSIVMITSVILWCSGGVLYLLTEGGEAMSAFPLGRKVFSSIFHSVSARTAGFNLFDMGETSFGGKVATIFLMMIGGAPGSIAGGIKLTTFAMVVLAIVSGYDGHRSINIFGRQIPGETLNKAFIVTVRIAIVIPIATIMLFVVEGGIDGRGVSPVDLLFETVSAFATVGLSTGVTTTLSSTGKVIIMLIMFTGRVGVVTSVIPAASPLAGDGIDRGIGYPKEEVLIG